jgi:hypothetical protein
MMGCCAKPSATTLHDMIGATEDKIRTLEIRVKSLDPAIKREEQQALLYEQQQLPASRDIHIAKAEDCAEEIRQLTSRMEKLKELLVVLEQAADQKATGYFWLNASQTLKETLVDVPNITRVSEELKSILHEQGKDEEADEWALLLPSVPTTKPKVARAPVLA